MAEYYITYNDYFGFCVVEKINGNGKIVFTGSIEDCNWKCIELNSLNQPKRSKIGASAVGWSPGSDDGRPERENMDDKIQILFELKLAGFDISASLEKMYQKYGKEEFQKAAQTSGYGFIFE